MAGWRTACAAFGAVGAQRRAERQYLLRTGEFANEPLDLGMIDAADLIGIGEIGDGGLARHQGKTIVLDREISLDRPPVENAHGLRIETPHGFRTVGFVE